MNLVDTALQIHTAVDMSFASDPVVKFITRIAGIIFLVVLIIRGLSIYADKSKRGELISEVIIGIICALMVFMPEVVLGMLTGLAGLVSGWFNL